MSRKLTKENYINRANKTHNNKYDYSLLEYTGMDNEITIICPIHGKFTQFANNHLRCGCYKCGFIITGNFQRHNVKDIINKSNIIHNYFYDYSLCDNYINCDTNVSIICPIHGRFETTFYLHNIRKQGCPVCKRSKGEIKIEIFLKTNNINL